MQQSANEAVIVQNYFCTCESSDPINGQDGQEGKKVAQSAVYHDARIRRDPSGTREAGGVQRTNSSSAYLNFNGHRGQWYEKEEVGSDYSAPTIRIGNGASGAQG